MELEEQSEPVDASSDQSQDIFVTVERNECEPKAAKSVCLKPYQSIIAQLDRSYP